jgi:serine/threonine-protein kinase
MESVVQRQDPLIGQVLDGRYRVDAVLGEGGMGIVYKAVHTALNKPLAIKVLRPEVSKNEQIVARFKQEAQSASQIGNQHIIDISDFGTLPDGSTYFVMEFLNGMSLTTALERSRFTPERTIHIAKQLCQALGAAHEIGIIHRDMKPDNVQLVERGDDEDFVKVLDFGIAKVGGTQSKLTQAGQVFGTPHYMSPEQCAGTAVDHRTDLYAVGVMLYEMATGKVPFDADHLMGILTKHLYENPIPPHELPPPVNVPPALESVILKCLAKKPEQRYGSMNELLEDLEALERGRTPKAVVDHVSRGTLSGQGPSSTDAPGRITYGVGQPEVPGQRSMKPLMIGGAVAVLLAGGVALALMGRGSDQPNVVKPAGETPNAAAPTPPTAPQPAPAAPEQPAAPAQPPQVTINSEPAGAEVYRSGALLGNTPYTMPRPDPQEQVPIELRMSGYQTKSFAITAMTEDGLKVTLTKSSSSSGRHGSSSRPAPTPVPTPAAPAEKPKPSKRPAKHGVDTEVLDPWG